jgi:hypothetical protein
MGVLAVIAIKFLTPAGEFLSLRASLKVRMRPLQLHAMTHTSLMPQQACPYLPKVGLPMSCRTLRDARLHQDWASYYQSGLAYGQFLWLNGTAGRSLLAIVRALYTSEQVQDATTFDIWPLPYRAVAWIAIKHPDLDFPGNPLLSFYHQASRMPHHFSELRRWRAWALYSLIDELRPELQSPRIDRHITPGRIQIKNQLKRLGFEQECCVWESAFDFAQILMTPNDV